MRYEVKPTAVTSESDTLFIPDDYYALSTIPYLLAGEVLYNRGEEKRAAEVLNFGLGQVKEMYDHYNQKTFEKLGGRQVKYQKGKFNV